MSIYNIVYSLYIFTGARIITIVSINKVQLFHLRQHFLLTKALWHAHCGKWRANTKKECSNNNGLVFLIFYDTCDETSTLNLKWNGEQKIIFILRYWKSKEN